MNIAFLSYEAVEDSSEEETTFPSCNIYSKSFTNRHFIDWGAANVHTPPPVLYFYSYPRISFVVFSTLYCLANQLILGNH